MRTLGIVLVLLAGWANIRLEETYARPMDAEPAAYLAGFGVMVAGALSFVFGAWLARARREGRR